MILVILDSESDSDDAGSDDLMRVWWMNEDKKSFREGRALAA
jgi:hypothetical protein